MSVSFGSRVRVSPDVLLQELAGEAVLLNLKTERYFGLDEVGICIWKAIVAAPSLAAAHQTLLAEFDVDAEKLHCDMDQLIEQLVQHGLLEVCAE